MSTRSYIGMINDNGSVSYIYCHFDGYLSHVGKTLQKHYNTKAKVKKLMELGDISSLGETLTDTIAYHRDRGEDLKTHRIGRLYYPIYEDSLIEYHYLFTNNVWKVSMHKKLRDFKAYESSEFGDVEVFAIIPEDKKYITQGIHAYCDDGEYEIESSIDLNKVSDEKIDQIINKVFKEMHNG